MSEHEQNVGTTALTNQPPRVSLVATMAAKFAMEPANFLSVVKKTIFPQDREVSNEQIAAFLAVAQQYDLNPFTREIFAFPSKGGGIQPIVSVDGWVKLIVSHSAYDGMDIQMVLEDKGGKPVSCTCTIFRKDREHTTPITEYYDECYRETEPWKKMPKRMLRHKAIKEAGRVTMGFAGIMDEDEGLDAIQNITSQSVELERTTNTKQEALKDKIGAKKTAKAEEKAAPAPEPVQTAPEPTPFEPAPIPEPETPVPAENLFSDDNGNKVVTEETRQRLLGVFKLRAGDDKVKQEALAKLTRKRLFDSGYTNSKEILNKDFELILKWAQEVQF